jgi:hypothetical protein
MRWRARPSKAATWSPWFAWYPVKAGQVWVWLETVMRYPGQFNGFYYEEPEYMAIEYYRAEV